MNKGGVLLYKCRKCGEIYSDLHAPDLLLSLICVYAGCPQPKDWGPTEPKMNCVHNCKDGALGMADLVGGEYDSQP